MSYIFKFKVLILITYCEARVFSASGSRQARHTQAEPWSYYDSNLNGNPGTYVFGYNDFRGQYRTEERHPNGTVTGDYGYVDPAGRPHQYRYIADHRGYRVMQDQILSPQRNPSPVSVPRPGPIDPVQEPSITWTRPRKPSKKKTKPVDRNRKKWSNLLLPPSYYALDN